VSVAVYERDRTPEARLQGYRLSIEPHGSAALHDCLPPELWQILVAASGDQGERMGVFDEQLHQLMEEDAKPDRADPASGSHAISRVTPRCSTAASRPSAASAFTRGWPFPAAACSALPHAVSSGSAAQSGRCAVLCSATDVTGVICLK
jgi:hypothetical protein